MSTPRRIVNRAPNGRKNKLCCYVAMLLYMHLRWTSYFCWGSCKHANFPVHRAENGRITYDIAIAPTQPHSSLALGYLRYSRLINRRSFSEGFRAPTRPFGYTFHRKTIQTATCAKFSRQRCQLHSTKSHYLIGTQHIPASHLLQESRV